DNNKLEANANIKEQTASVTVTDDNTFKTHDQVSITDKDETNITATSDLDIIDNNKLEANANIKEQTASVTVTDDNTFKTHDQVSITDKDGTNVTATSDLDIIDNNKLEANANIKEQTASVTVTDDNTFKTHDQVSITDKD